MAPARLAVRAGAFALMALCAGCERDADAGPRVLELTHDTIQLQQGVHLHEITVRRAQTEFEPARVEAAIGDVVRFTAADGAGHAVAFEGGQLPADVRAWLERTGQLRGPPLLAEGGAWVITLEGAPTGEYPFRCTTHGATGVLTVGAATR